MLSQTQGIIYLSSQRGCTQTNRYRSFHVFNYGDYFNEYRKPFGDLTVLNDDTLRQGDTLRYTIDEDILLVLLPVIGDLHYSDSVGRICDMEPGQLFIFFLPQGSSFGVTNPYEKELINFLHIRLKGDSEKHWDYAAECRFDLDKDANQLISLAPENKEALLSLYIGKFEGREEAVLKLKDRTQGVFLFIVEGVFEAQNRLLQPRDALALWDTNDVAFEALSNHAVIFIIDSINLTETSL